jgi:hypothetical protein
MLFYSVVGDSNVSGLYARSGYSTSYGFSSTTNGYLYAQLLVSKPQNIALKDLGFVDDVRIGGAWDPRTRTCSFQIVGESF